MRISDWSSDVCSSDLNCPVPVRPFQKPACLVILLFTMRETRRTFFDNKSTDPIRPALFSRPGHDYGHIARFAVCDPVLGAINYIMIAFPDEIGRASCRERVCKYV